MSQQRGEDEIEGEELEAEILETDHGFGVDSFGTTAEEQLEGESLDQELARERPDRPTDAEAVAIVDDGPEDTEDELIGEAVLDRDEYEFVAPEEAAMSVRDRAPGATDHPDEHPDQDDDEADS